MKIHLPNGFFYYEDGGRHPSSFFARKTLLSNWSCLNRCTKSMYNKETVSSINENSQDEVCSQGQKTTE